MTVRCLSSSLEPRKKKISNTGKQCNHVLIPRNYILSDSKKSLPSVERWNKQEQRTRNIGLNLADFAVGEEVVCILLLHSLTHSLTQQDNIMASPPYEVVATKIGHNYTLV